MIAGIFEDPNLAHVGDVVNAGDGGGNGKQSAASDRSAKMLRERCCADEMVFGLVDEDRSSALERAASAWSRSYALSVVLATANDVAVVALNGACACDEVEG